MSAIGATTRAGLEKPRGASGPWMAGLARMIAIDNVSPTTIPLITADAVIRRQYIVNSSAGRLAHAAIDIPREARNATFCFSAASAMRTPMAHVATVAMRAARC